MNKETIEKLLKDSHLKVTKKRIAVFNVLTSVNEPLSIDEIFMALPMEMNKTTLYRILHAYTSLGLIYQTDFRDGKAYFEFQDKHHHHIVCTDCGIREDITNCTFGGLIPQLTRESKKFDIVKSHSLEFFGICKKCKSV